jgi:hypothetical protein
VLARCRIQPQYLFNLAGYIRYFVKGYDLLLDSLKASYPVFALQSALGGNRLMPNSELEYMLITFLASSRKSRSSRHSLSSWKDRVLTRACYGISGDIGRVLRKSIYTQLSYVFHAHLCSSLPFMIGEMSQYFTFPRSNRTERKQPKNISSTLLTGVLRPGRKGVGRPGLKLQSRLIDLRTPASEAYDMGRRSLRQCC